MSTDNLQNEPTAEEAPAEEAEAPEKPDMPVGHTITLDAEERAAIKALQAAVEAGKATAYRKTLEAVEQIRREELVPLEQALQRHIRKLADERELAFIEEGAQWTFNPEAMTFIRTK